MKKYPIEFKNHIEDLVLENWNITSACRIACVKFNIDYNDGIRRSISSYLERKGVTDNVVKDSDLFKDAQKKQLDRTKKRFIVSWCQSETKIHDKFLTNIEAYAKHIDADISIIAGRYKNPTSLKKSEAAKNKEEKTDKSWDARVVPYLDANRHKIHKYLCILSDLKIQPTASTPLSGINGLTGLESCIVGHPRVHLKSLPVLDGYPNKLLLTTGAVSVENYTDTKSGKKGEFHHTLGFVVVELDGTNFHVRQVTADDDGSFYDLALFVDNGDVITHGGAEIVVFGDLHIGETNEEVLDASFKMADRLKCNDIILHDVFNGHSISHHERSQPFQLLKRENDGSDNLYLELTNIAEFFRKHNDFNFIVVRSNHDEFLDRWLSSNDWRNNTNKMAYLEFAYHLAANPNCKGVIPLFLEMKEVTNAYCLGIDESYRVLDIELGIHGHIGANGSRGGAIQYSQMNTKTVTGHSHSPIRLDGHSSVGTLTHLRVGYNTGPSSWLNTNVVIYPNGKHQHVHIINNKYTTL